MEAGTKVVMTQQMIAPLIDNELEEGMCFIYRGTCLGGEVHEFAPDFDQGHNTGFQVPQKIFDDPKFRRQFKVVTDW